MTAHPALTVNSEHEETAFEPDSNAVFLYDRVYGTLGDTKLFCRRKMRK